MSQNKENSRYSNISKNVGSINEFVCKYFQNSQIVSTSSNDNPSINLDTINPSRSNIVYNNYAINDNKAKENSPITEINAISEYDGKIYTNKPRKNDIYFHNPDINKKMFSLSTLKYLAILIVVLTLIASFLFFLIIALINFNTCSIENNADIPIYLITLGLVGIMRVFLFFSCPYSYSESLAFKMYEHLVWRLIINRFKSSYYSAALVYATYSPSSLIESQVNAAKQSQIFLKFKCLVSFFFSFFCCNFVCISFCNNLFDTNSKNNILFRNQHKNDSSNPQVNLVFFIVFVSLIP